MKFPLLHIDGSKADSIEISDKLVKLKVNHKLIKYVIDWQFNHLKPRTAKTKQRNEIKGSIPGSKNSTVILRESVKNITRKTIKEKHEAKIKAAVAKKGKK